MYMLFLHGLLQVVELALEVVDALIQTVDVLIVGSCSFVT